MRARRPPRECVPRACRSTLRAAFDPLVGSIISPYQCQSSFSEPEQDLKAECRMVLL
jgi:hypothetical protein